MNPKPLVSIIIPFVYEVGYLREAVQSALDQKPGSFQILLVCNAPDMAKVDDQHPFNHASISWLHEPAPGAPHARNMGLAHAEGDWIQFLDVDDLLLPDKIATQLTYADADVVVSPATYRYENGREKRGNWNRSDVWYALLASQLGSTSSMLWKRSILQLVGGWNPAYDSNQEYELLFRILQAKGRIEFEDKPLTIVRQRTVGSITSSRLNHPMIGIRLRENIWEHLRTEGLDTPVRQEAFRTYIFKNLRGLFRQDKKLAIQLHATYFSNPGFTPNIGIRGYNYLYQKLGFKRTEELMHLYRRIRQKWFFFLPKNE